MKILFILFCFSLKIFAFDVEFQSFSSDFLQKVNSKSNSSIEYKGNFILTQDKAYWNYTFPNPKQIYIQNNEIIILEHDLEQVIFAKLQNLPNLNEIFKKAKKINANFYEAKYENVLYEIQLKNDEIYQISYQDELENTVIMTLSNIKRNEKINPQIFTPKIPKNYDILH